jgi:hypothetical protein
MRFLYLNALYEKSDGDSHAHIDMWELGEEIQFTKEVTDKVVEYLKGEHLLEYVTLGGIIAITHYGVVKVEEALSSPQEETKYFPPVVNIMNVHNIIGSQVQQGSDGSRQTISLSESAMSSMHELVKELLGKITSIELDENISRDAEAEIKTIDAQLSASKPKLNIIKESLNSLKIILESAAGNVIAAEFLKKWLPFIMGILGSS